MSWINKILPSIRSNNADTEGNSKQKSSVPEGLWKKCPRCEAVLYRPDLERNLEVCPKCDHHMRITARRRLELFLDEAGQEELFSDIEPVDILKFKDLKKYKDRLAAAQRSTGEKDALIVMQGRSMMLIWSWQPLNLVLSAVPWGPWWVRSLSRRSIPVSSTVSRLFASPPVVAPACRKPWFP